MNNKMFPTVSTLDLASYDFTSKENESKWKGIFISGLQRVSTNISIAICIL